MSGVTRFENLIAWQKARVLAGKVYSATREEEFRRDYELAGQVRSAAAFMANIAEGFERSRRAELLQFLSIAKGSCGEVRSHLYVAFDAGYLGADQFEGLKSAAEEVSRILSGLHSSIRSKTPSLR